MQQLKGGRMSVPSYLERDQCPEREVGCRCKRVAAGIYFWALGPSHPTWGMKHSSGVSQDRTSFPVDRGL